MIDVVDMFYKDIISANDVYILLIGCLQCDLSVLQIAKKLLICLLTIDNIYFAYVVMHC